jgi:outer membrane receptor for ferrienterochelin and colicins
VTRLGSLFCALALLIASPAQADNTADEADVAFTLGNRAYAKREYDKALASYLLSHRLVPNQNVLFNIARCYEQLKKFDEAFRYYFELSSQKLDDDDAREVRGALGRLTPKVALLTITSQPEGADVYVDREDLGSRGRTPLTLALPPGPHTTKLKLAGYRNTEGKASVGKGRDVRTKLVLERILGTLELTGSPEGASVRESSDGPEIAKLPATLSLTPGQKVLFITAAGFTPQQLIADVKPEAVERQKANLIPLPSPMGKVIVTANRENALVRVDGKESGFTPTVLSLPVGEYEIEVSAHDLTASTSKVKVGKDTEERIAAELRYLPPAVSAASKSLLSVDEAPASVTVITREELQSFGYQSLAEALQAVRGIFLSNDRIYTYLGIRGFSPPGDLNTRIAILWDGHVMNDVWAGQGYAARDLDVDLAEIERIEVIRGPGSTLYGTGAIFAVINLVPRSTLGQRNVEATLGTGGQGGVSARLTTGLEGHAGSLLASAAGFQSTGAPLTDFGNGNLVQGFDAERSLGATVRAKAGGFTLTGKINQRRKEVPTLPGGATVPGTKYADTRGFAELRYDHDFERVSVAARVSYDGSRFRGTYVNGDDMGNRYYASDLGGGDWLGLELRARIRLFGESAVGENHLSVGFEGQGSQLFQQSVDAMDMGAPADTHRRLLVSGYLLDEWKVHPRLLISAGVRVDKYFDLGDLPVSPRLGIVGKPYANGVTKLVVGQSFRAPNVYEAYFQDNFASQRAAGALKPETITTFEAEHSHDLTEELRISVAGYYNLINQLVVLNQEDLPIPECGGGMNQCLQYGTSAAQVTALGAEAQLRWQPGRYTLIDATYSFVTIGGPSADSSVSDIRTGAPMHLASMRALVPIYEGAVRLSGQLTYQSARGGGVGEALLINFGLSGEYKHLRYFAGVQNLLDARYTLPSQSEAGFIEVPQYGRTFLLQLTAGF